MELINMQIAANSWKCSKKTIFKTNICNKNFWNIFKNSFLGNLNLT